jgi:hypothetical protein
MFFSDPGVPGRFRKKMKQTLRTAAIGIAALATVAASYGQGTFIVNGKHYIVHRDGIPDLDQRKMADAVSGVTGLPNGGNMYCVPTSTLNNLAYLANHGYPLLDPGVGSWESSAPPLYNHVTATQLITGILYHTDPQKGTGGIKGYLQTYLDTAYPGQFAVSEIYDTTSFVPTVYDGALALLNGSLVNLCYGWYKKDSYYNWATFSYEPFYYRSGGHCVTMVGAQDWNGTINVSLHDPANPNDGNLFTQSPFQDDISTLQFINATFSWEDTFTEDEDKFNRTMQVMDYSGGYVDNILKITPKYGYTYQDEDILFITPNSPTDERGVPERPPFTLINTNVGRKITDLAIDPFSERTTFVADDTDALFNFDPVTREVTRVLEVSNPRQVVYDDDGRLIVLRDHILDTYSRLLHRERNIGLQQPLDTIAFDQKSGRIVGYSRHANLLYIFDKLLHREGTVELPNSAAPPAKPKLFFDEDGNGYLLGRGSRYITKVSIDRLGHAETSQIPVPSELANPDGGYVDERGKVFLTIQGSIVPLDEDGHVDRVSRFFGKPAGDGLHIVRPFANKSQTR